MINLKQKRVSNDTLFFYFSEPHLSRNAHSLHPQEQEDLPFFLEIAAFTIIATTTAQSTDSVNIVCQFINCPPYAFLKIFFIFPITENFAGLKSKYRNDASTINATTVKNPNEPYLISIPN